MDVKTYNIDSKKVLRFIAANAVYGRGHLRRPDSRTIVTSVSEIAIDTGLDGNTVEDILSLLNKKDILQCRISMLGEVTGRITIDGLVYCITAILERRRDGQYF